MVNPVFIIDTMREMDYRYFVILDMQFNTVYQQFQPVSMEEAVKRFERFLKNAGSAMYRVRIYQNNERKVSGEPKGNFFQYEIMLTESVKGPEEPDTNFPARSNPTPINGSGLPDAMQSVMTQGGMMGGVGLDRYLSEKDRILELMLRIQQLELEKKYLEEKLERRESELRREMEQQNSSETRIQGIINNVLPNLMAGFQGQAPMNGIPQSNSNNMDNKTQETEKNAIVNAVNKLMKIDPDFAKNISALADLAAKKPDVYKMAVNYLNTL
jgi:hypothetical protein